MTEGLAREGEERVEERAYTIRVHVGCGGQVDYEGGYDGQFSVCQKCGADDFYGTDLPTRALEVAPASHLAQAREVLEELERALGKIQIAARCSTESGLTPRPDIAKCADDALAPDADGLHGGVAAAAKDRGLVSPSVDAGESGKPAATTQQRLSQAEEVLREIADHEDTCPLWKDSGCGVALRNRARAYFHPDQGESE